MPLDPLTTVHHFPDSSLTPASNPTTTATDEPSPTQATPDLHNQPDSIPLKPDSTTDELPDERASRAPATINALPHEIVRMIANHLPNPYGLMRASKHTLYPAGEALYGNNKAAFCRMPLDLLVYDNVPSATLGDGGKIHCAHCLFVGLEHVTPNPSAPFGRDLKLHLLKHFQTPFLAYYEEGVLSGPNTLSRDARSWFGCRHATDRATLSRLRRLPKDLLVLPHVRHLAIGDRIRYSVGPGEAYYGQHRTPIGTVLARHSTPDAICVSVSLYTTVEFYPDRVGRYDIACFGQHKPSAVNVHVGRGRPSFIRVCYDTLNRVPIRSLSCHSAADLVDITIRTLQRVHPDVDGKGYGSHGSTRWEFLIVGMSDTSWFPDIKGEVDRSAPGLKGWVEFRTGPRCCETCGEDEDV